MCYNDEKIGCDFMAEEKIYKQVPLIGVKNRQCPICKGSMTGTKIGAVMLYKSPDKTKIINQKMRYCKTCDIMYVTSQMCKDIKRANQGYEVASFHPNSNLDKKYLKYMKNGPSKKEYIEKRIEYDYHPQYVPTQKPVSNSGKAVSSIRIGDKIFDTYHISQCNIKKLAKNVYTTPVGFYNCPICGKPLIRDYVYAVQVNDTECIKSNGCMCSSCDAFFTISQKLFYNLEKMRVNKNAYDLKPDYCVSYDYKKYSSIFNEKESTYKQITVCAKNDLRTYTIVYDSWEENKQENIIYYSSELAVKLLIAERDKKAVDINNKSFQIVKVRSKNIDIAQKREIDNVVLHKKYFNNELPEFSSQNTLYVYNGKITCHKKHSVTEIDAYIDDFDGGKYSFFAEYCYDCDKFIMKYDDYKQYLKEYHFFPMKISMLNMNYDDYNRAEQSPLMINGYTVNATDDYSAGERQKILQGIINNGILSKRKVLDYLEMFIKESENNPRKQIAVSKWKEDKAFVLNYSFNSVPQVRIWKIQCRK